MANKLKNERKPESLKAKQEISTSNRQIAVAEYRHEGPIPDPMTLDGYNQIVPGAAERIIVMAENQAKHRQDIEKIVIKARSRDSLLGIIFGFVIALTTIIAGVYVIVKGFAWSGTILGSAGLIGLVSVFIYGTRSNRKEREQKDRQS